MNEDEKIGILEAVDEAKTMLDSIQQSISALNGNNLLPLINRVEYLEKKVERVCRLVDRVVDEVIIYIKKPEEPDVEEKIQAVDELIQKVDQAVEMEPADFRIYTQASDHSPAPAYVSLKDMHDEIQEIETVNEEIDKMPEVPAVKKKVKSKKKKFSRKKKAPSPYTWEKIQEGDMGKGETQIWKYKDRTLELSMKDNRMFGLVDGKQTHALDRQKDLTKLQKGIESEVDAIQQAGKT